MENPLGKPITVADLPRDNGPGVWHYCTKYCQNGPGGATCKQDFSLNSIMFWQLQVSYVGGDKEDDWETWLTHEKVAANEDPEAERLRQQQPSYSSMGTRTYWPRNWPGLVPLAQRPYFRIRHIHRAQFNGAADIKCNGVEVLGSLTQATQPSDTGDSTDTNTLRGTSVVQGMRNLSGAEYQEELSRTSNPTDVSTQLYHEA
jgi:hypothetical protein